MTTFKDYLYERPDLNKQQETFNALLQQFQSAGSAAEQIKLMEDINVVCKDIDTAENIAMIRASIDTNDQYYSEERDYFDNNGAQIVAMEKAFFEALLASPYQEELKARFKDQLFHLAENTIGSYSDEVADLINEENKVSSEYSKLIASAQIDFEGQTLTIAQMGKYLQSPDRAMRQRALTAVQSFMGAHLKEFDDIYDRLVHIRHSIATKLGYDNFIELGYKRMQRIGYNAEDVARYREQIKEHVVPLATRLFEEQAARIGVDQLKYYDNSIVFLSGNEYPKDAPAEIMANGQKMYDELSKETGDFYRFMLERELFDVEAKKGKEAGGYCTFIQNYKSPFIFSNFNQTDHDITVLTHEAGHAFQVYSAQHHIPDYIWPTHEACEIHSMSMEFLTYPWMHLFFNNADKFKYKHITDAVKFLPYGVAVDEFQHRVYEQPDLTPEERRRIWQEIEKKYLPHTDYDGILPLAEGSLWHRQGHIFNSPFYYIDYTLAQVCAFQFFKKSREDFDSAWQDYLRICEIGGSLAFNDIVEAAHLQSPFKEGTLEEIVSYLTDYIDSIDTSSF